MKQIPGIRYESPYKFTLKERIILNTAPAAIAVCVKGLMATCRKDLRHIHRIMDLQPAGDRAIAAFWHESLAMAACLFRNTGYHTLTSYSFDGELAARVVNRFGMCAVRGSSSRGGSEAIASLIEAAKHVGCVGFTLDGPRGPRREAKPGIGILAARTGLPVIPIAITAAPAWRLNSWDKMPIPKPRAQVILECGEPIPPPPEDTPQQIEQMRLRTQQTLNELHDKLDRGLL